MGMSSKGTFVLTRRAQTRVISGNQCPFSLGNGQTLEVRDCSQTLRINGGEGEGRAPDVEL